MIYLLIKPITHMAIDSSSVVARLRYVTILNVYSL